MIAVEIVTAEVLPDFPRRIEFEVDANVRFVVDSAAANELAPSGDSTILSPVPFKLSPLKVGLLTSRVTDESELNAVPLANVAVPGVVLVDSETAPVVEETVPEPK